MKISAVLHGRKARAYGAISASPGGPIDSLHCRRHEMETHQVAHRPVALCRLRPLLYSRKASRSALASFKSGVSKPSVNQP
jgi:hypothetical protein